MLCRICIVNLDGTITKVAWTNPHAYLYLDSKDNNGKTANRNDTSSQRDAVGTSGNDLPRTASPLAFIGLLGALSSLSAFALPRARR